MRSPHPSPDAPPPTPPRQEEVAREAPRRKLGDATRPMPTEGREGRPVVGSVTWLRPTELMPLLTGTAASALYRQQVALARRLRQLPDRISTTRQHARPALPTVDHTADRGQSVPHLELP